jgi:hypothetical protein
LPEERPRKRCCPFKPRQFYMSEFLKILKKYCRTRIESDNLLKQRKIDRTEAEDRNANAKQILLLAQWEEKLRKQRGRMREND